MASTQAPARIFRRVSSFRAFVDSTARSRAKQQIQQVQELIRRGVERVKETVKGLVRGPQPDHADTPDEPPTAARPKPAPQPQHGGDRGADDDWMPGDGFLGRR